MRIGLYDADLMDGGTRHPNLTLMKLSQYFQTRGDDVKLLLSEDEGSLVDRVYVSKVFSKTNDPSFVCHSSVYRGGTGYYTDNPALMEEDFKRMRIEDMIALETHLDGYDERTQMPDYHLYDSFLDGHTDLKKYKDYLDFSIGFLTRGCIRQCPFCVNRYEERVKRYSHLCDFLDDSRKYVYLWDDNVMAATPALFDECFGELIECGKPFQFKQGLDLRLMTERKAEILTTCRYYGDYIFAFDNWDDRDWIEQKLDLWRQYTAKSTKLYLFCGYRQSGGREEFYEDIMTVFKRVEILMRYGCLGYVMRHVDYMTSYMPNMYVQVARWCNQPSMYKKMSFTEFIVNHYKKGDKPYETYTRFLNEFRDRRTEINHYFNLKYENEGGKQ